MKPVHTPVAPPTALMRRICRDAWKQDLLSGCNGNASCRLDGAGEQGETTGHIQPGIICITRSGSAKGRLTDEDLCLMDLCGSTLCGGPASSEAGMHLSVYRALPGCRAVLHVHPRRLLALSLRCQADHDFLRLPLFEAETWRARLAHAPALPPGSEELALAVAQAARDYPKISAVWMAGHGLCCLGQSLAEALTTAEELEHLAAIQLLACA